MPVQSAGILVFRKNNGDIEFLLAHPGGPFYKNKDEGSWSIPKGELDEEEDPLAAAKREFFEETGLAIKGKFMPLIQVKYKSGKIIHAWAVEADLDISIMHSNTFLLEWPPRSKKMMEVAEIDRCDWFTYELAKKKILPALAPLLDDLLDKIAK